ncbi:MAG: polymer-forming cytoskeletal protein [Salinirussus sp.]
MQLFRSDPLDELVVPDGTHVQEHDLVTEGDVLVGGGSTVEFGVRGGTVVAGERVTVDGRIEADGDCRLDMWCEVTEDVLVGEDAYIGERATIGGELRVAGDLDVGDDVEIAEGFEAAGWIVIRNPMPTITFLFIYLSQLLRIGEEEAAEEMLATLMADDRDHQPIVVPRGARLEDDAWRVSTPARIGDDCRLHGNVRAKSLVVGRSNEVFGSLRAREGVTVGADTEVTGNVTTRTGSVRVGPGAEIRGDVSGDRVEIHRQATVEGAIRATEKTSMISRTVLDDVTEAVEAGTDTGADADPESESESESGSETETGDADAGVASEAQGADSTSENGDGPAPTGRATDVDAGNAKPTAPDALGVIEIPGDAPIAGEEPDEDESDPD